MSTQHTPGPWIFDHRDGYLRTADGNNIVQTYNEANAQRIVECVNACEGIENPTEFMQKLRGSNMAFFEAIEHEHTIDRLRSALQGTVNALQALPPSVLDDEHIQAINDANEVLTELRLDQEGGQDV